MFDSSKPQYQLNETGEFVITDYNSAKLFSSFFPGVAGQDGIPMWTFYVNRGQCVCSMGIQDKEHAIMEFFPANRAYQLASTQGFRTFIKPADHALSFYEPFQNRLADRQVERTQRMIIRPSGLVLEEVNHSLGLTFHVEYCNVPQDDYAGLIRTLRITNNNDEPFTLEGLDGMPLVVPYGVDNGALKFTRRLTEAFVEVVNHEQKAPLFRSKVEPVDRPEVVRIKQGNFYLGFASDSTNGQLSETVVDPVRIFGSQSDYSYPERFITADEVLTGQVLENRLPCAMGLFNTTIPAGESWSYTSITGHAASVEELNAMVPRITDPAYIAAKVTEDRELIEKLTQSSFICSNEPTLDQYTRQNYLDNGLRGGFPITLQGEKSKTAFYMYARKHGDLERDYNHFSLSPTKYSQGNANYRDINQNRRNDLFFNPDVKADNVEHFYNLIQLDGFNPLVIKEVYFTARDSAELDQLLAQRLDGEVSAASVAALKAYILQSFTPGLLLAWLQEQKMVLQGTSESFLADLIALSDRVAATEHGEGFWSDHWTYNLDLLENYLALYPEQLKPLLFEQQTFTFYDNAHCVQPRDDKYVLWDGNPMQLHAVTWHEEKEQLIARRTEQPNAMRSDHGQGEVYRTTLVNKILSLIVNKLASLDPEGVGVEMESDKPNWYDALNGLPGVLGSSSSETLEIKRNILFLLKTFDQLGLQDEQWPVFAELNEFFNSLHSLLNEDLSAFDFWDQATTAKEIYRAATLQGVNGKETTISVKTLRKFFAASLKKLDAGIAKAWNQEAGIISTYFVSEVVEYEEIKGADGSAKLNVKGMPCFRARKFKHHHLPPFLEGPVHYLRTLPKQGQARELAQNIKKSGLYDQQLKMYKVNAALTEEPMEIGRARVFSPGWFENESVWLHMEYKYMLELLRNGLFNEFYADFRDVMVPFFDPATYGRSILENASFIVSSANPDPSIHGNGFVARLSGATAEFINMMLLMTVGQKPFSLNDDGELQLNFEPALPGSLFTTEIKKERLFRNGRWTEVVIPADSFSFMFLSDVQVIYRNPRRGDTFGPEKVVPVSWTIEDHVGFCQTINDHILTGSIVEKIRAGKVRRIEIALR